MCRLMVSLTFQFLQALKKRNETYEIVTRHHSKISTAFPESGMPKFMDWGNI